jgi:tetratricopeptide (TPR) repeat protein
MQTTASSSSDRAVGGECSLLNGFSRRALGGSGGGRDVGAYPGMSVNPRRIWKATRLVLVALAVGGGLVAAEAERVTEPMAAEAWAQLGRLLFDDAQQKFTAAELAGATGPDLQLGQAVSWLMRQPKTSGNVEQALLGLRQVQAEEPAGSRWQLAARYLEGRVWQFHHSQPDEARAAQIYAELWQAYPETYWGQVAFLKLAIIRLYAPGEGRERKRQVLEELAVEVERVGEVAVRSTVHRALSEAYARLLGDLAGQMRHGWVALKLGVAKENARARLLVQVGQAAQALGEAEVAREAYQRFLADFPRDERAWLVARRLAALPREAGS